MEEYCLLTDRLALYLLIGLRTLPSGGTAPMGDLSCQSNQEDASQTCLQTIWWKQSLNQAFFLPDNFPLCQADRELRSTFPFLETIAVIKCSTKILGWGMCPWKLVSTPVSSCSQTCLHRKSLKCSSKLSLTDQAQRVTLNSDAACSDLWSMWYQQLYPGIMSECLVVGLKLSLLGIFIP